MFMCARRVSIIVIERYLGVTNIVTIDSKYEEIHNIMLTLPTLGKASNGSHSPKC